MTKDEVLALGVSEDKYRAFQEAYRRDLNKVANQKRIEDETDWKTRSAINAMVKLIKKPETLNDILKFINKAYYREV